MAKNRNRPGGSIGDIRDILHNQGTFVNHSWLWVDEEEYRKHEALPKQNLDIIPELTRALIQEPDERIPRLIPLRPHVMVNERPERPIGRVNVETPIRNRVANLVMQGFTPNTIGDRLRLEFAESDLRQNIGAIREIMEERGLLGNVYINASNFPRCEQGGEAKEFVSKHAKHSLFVLAKDECSDCVHARSGFCSVFKKRIVDQVPYDENVFGHYASQLEKVGKRYDGTGDVRLRLRQAFLQPVRLPSSEPVLTVRAQKPVEAKPDSDQIKSYIQRQSNSPSLPMPGKAYSAYARRMMLGHDDSKILSNATDAELRFLSREYGLLGHTYLDVDSLGGCRKTLAFIKENDLFPDFLIRRSGACSICKGASDGACCALSQIAIIVNEFPSIDRHVFGLAVERAMRQGRITEDQARAVSSNLKDDMNLIRLTSQINLFKPKDDIIKVYDKSNLSFYHMSQDPVQKGMDPEEVRRTISSLMNTGLHGKRLISAVLNRYTKSDLMQVPEIGKIASSNDGVQGHYFIDPTAYSDYGKGCVEGSNLFKRKSVPHVFAGAKCTGCIHQLAPGKCSKYMKDLIRSVPDEVVASYKRKISLPVVSSVENPIKKYELQSSMDFQPQSNTLRNVEISIPSSQIT